MCMQDEWRTLVLSELKEEQTWNVIKDKPVEEKVSLILETFGKMYQQPENPFNMIGCHVSNMKNNLSSLGIQRLDNKRGKDFFISVIELIQKDIEKKFKNEFETVKNEIKQDYH